mgnify:CR=1 FL=1
MEFVVFTPEDQSRMFHALSYNTTVIFVCCMLIIFAALIDLWTGLDAARANKERIRSRALRRTVTKTLDYLRVVLFGVLIDVLGLFFPWYVLPYCALLCTLGVMLIEGRSVLENLRKKKSHAADIASMVGKIVQCIDEKDAQKIISELRGGSEKTE